MDGFWYQVMIVSAWVTLALCSIIGLAGTLLPGIPGGGLILIGAVAFALMTGFQWLSWPSLLILTLLALVGGIGQYFVSGYGARKFGASRWGAIGALLGFFVGMLVFPPLGALIGAFLGAVAVELIRLNVADRKRDKDVLRSDDESPELLEAGPVEPHPSTDDDSRDAALEAVEAGPPARAGFRERSHEWLAGLGGSKLSDQTKQATLAGVGAVLGAVGSFLFEFVFGVVMVVVIVVALIV